MLSDKKSTKRSIKAESFEDNQTMVDEDAADAIRLASQKKKRLERPSKFTTGPQPPIVNVNRNITGFGIPSHHAPTLMDGKYSNQNQPMTATTASSTLTMTTQPPLAKGPVNYNFDTTNFRDSQTTSTKIEQSGVKLEFKAKPVTNHQTPFTAFDVDAEDDDGPSTAQLVQAAQSNDPKQLNELVAQLKNTSIAKGIEFANSTMKGKGKGKFVIKDEIGSVLGTMKLRIKDQMTDLGYTVQQFFNERRNIRTETVMMSVLGGENKPKLTSVTHIPNKIPDNTATTGVTGELQAVAAYAREKCAMKMPIGLFRASESIRMESGGRLRMSDTLAVTLEEFKLWAPLHASKAWLEFSESRTHEFNQSVFDAPVANTDGSRVLMTFVSADILRSGAVSVGDFQRLFGSMKSKDADSNRETLFRLFRKGDLYNALQRKFVINYQTGLEVTAAVKEAVENTEAKYVRYAHAFARLKQLMIHSPNNSTMNVSKEIDAQFADIWNDQTVVSLEKQLPPFKLLTQQPAQSVLLNQPLTGPSVYASAQPPLQSTVPPTRR